MNWNRIILLLLPIKLRRAARLRCLLTVLLCHTVRDARIAEQWRDTTEADVRRLGQYGVVLLIVRKHCCHIGCYISDAVEGNVRIFWADGPLPGDNVVCGNVAENPPAHRVVVHSVADTDTGSDFVVHIPHWYDTREVWLLVRRYVFAGIEFSVSNDIYA